MMTNFKRQLHAAGYSGETDEFYRTVADLFSANCPGQTDEQLKRNPREALRFCEDVRKALSLPNLADDLILGALENHRKHRKRLSKTA